jgi:regulation of enolase protein 1 (concanavalin A-like superfamily)
MWAAGVPIKQRIHAGLTHMKTLVTSTYATNASSNFGAGWQRDNDYFVSAAAKPAIYGAIKNRVQAMWNDSAAFGPFQPQPPDAASLSTPASGAAGVSTATELVWNRAAFAVSYDVYLGSAPSGMVLVGNVPAQLVNDPPATYSWTPSAALQAGTTYYWKVVSRTYATPVNPSLIGTSDTWSFGTAAVTPPPGGTLPAPWSSRDVGSVGAAGSASYSNGVFTIKGAGTWIWDTTDSFQYVSQPTSGDVQIVAHVTSLVNTSTFAKAGVMLRESLSPNAANVVLDVRPNGAIEFMTRSASGATETFLATANLPPPGWLRLTRSGTTVTAAVSANGSTWTTVGSTTFSISSSALVGLVVCSASSSLTTATFDGVSVSGSVTPPPPPPPTAADVVIYASDLPSSARHGSWRTASDATSPNAIKLTTPDNGLAWTDAPQAAPADYVDVTFSAVAGTPYRIWLRLKALSNSKYNDAVWVQFSDATVNGSPMYRINTTNGLLVNLATDSAATSLNGWGWQNAAYWLSQPTVVTFPTTGTRTLRVQVREDGVQLDQIVLSPGRYLNAAPGGVTNDSTIVPKP